MIVPDGGSACVHGDAGRRDHRDGTGGVDHAPGLAPGPDGLRLRGDRLAEHLDDVRGRMVGRKQIRDHPGDAGGVSPPRRR